MPYTSGARACLRIAAAASAASSKLTARPWTRASGASVSPANHASPSAHVRVTLSSPSATVASMSSQAHPHPAHVASATGGHLHCELRTQARGLALELREDVLRRRGSGHDGADRPARRDALP